MMVYFKNEHHKIKEFWNETIKCGLNKNGCDDSLNILAGLEFFVPFKKIRDFYEQL
jgi:hypothetical protein